MTPPEQRAGDIAASWDADVNSDDIFDVLTSSRRRFVIAHLQTRSRSMAVADLATALTRWECDPTDSQIPKDEVTTRYLALHHAHLPKMAAVGLIEWNHERNTVGLTEAVDEIPDECSLPSVGETR